MTVTIGRRELLAALGAAAAWPLAAGAQQAAKLPVIGVLSASSPSGRAHLAPYLLVWSPGIETIFDRVLAPFGTARGKSGCLRSARRLYIEGES